MSEHNSTPRLTAGSIALTALGWLELLVSAWLFGSGLYAVAIIFALVSLAVQFVATQFRRPAWDTRPVVESVTPTAGMLRAGQVLFVVAIALGFASVAGAVLFLLRGTTLPAVVLGLWALALGMQAYRLRARHT